MKHFLHTIYVVFVFLRLSPFVSSSPVRSAEQASELESTDAVALRPGHTGVRKGDPATWDKPYAGQASKKCRARPAAEAIQALLQVNHQLIVPLGKLIDPEDVMEESGSGKSTLRRSDGLTTSLAEHVHPIPHDIPPRATTKTFSTWFLECPRMGRIIKAFMWGATYLADMEEVLWERIFQIDEFLATTYNPASGYTAAIWKHEWCQPVGHYECWYIAIGHVDGTVNRHADTIETHLATEDPDHGRRPYVYEFCSLQGMPRSVNGYSCLVDRVVNLHPPA